MTVIAILSKSPVFASGLAQLFIGAGFTASIAHSGCLPLAVGKAGVVVLESDAARAPELRRLCGENLIPPLLVMTTVAARPASTRVSSLVDTTFPLVHATIDRNASAASFLDAVRSLLPQKQLDGDEVASPALPDAMAAALSEREREVLGQIARGLTYGQVARQLAISAHTVDTYVRRIRTKLNVGNKAELTMAAMIIAAQPGRVGCAWCG